MGRIKMHISKIMAIFKDLIQVFREMRLSRKVCQNGSSTCLVLVRESQALLLPRFVLRNIWMALNEISMKFSPKHTLWKVSIQTMAEDYADL